MEDYLSLFPVKDESLFQNVTKDCPVKVTVSLYFYGIDENSAPIYRYKQTRIYNS